MASYEMDELPWLVHHRSEIQFTLLDLYASSKSEGIGGEKLKMLALLSGAAFSLWRAVFLVGDDRGDENLLSKLRVFLERVIKDNSIGYPQDKDSRAWTVGYYISSANYRLLDVAGRLEGQDLTDELKSALSRLRNDGGTTTHDTQVEWQQSHEALRLLMSTLGFG